MSSLYLLLLISLQNLLIASSISILSLFQITISLRVDDFCSGTRINKRNIGECDVLLLSRIGGLIGRCKLWLLMPLLLCLKFI